VAYAGVTASGVVYAIGTGFTVPDSFPEMSQGDIETATIFTRGMRKIQGKFSSILTGGANANFTAMPQVGGDPIVESGSNSDGEWTRWSDGTLIVQNRLTLAYYSSTQFKLTWTYPSSFISTALAPSISSVNFASDASFSYFEPYHLSNQTGQTDIEIRLVMAASVVISSDTFRVGASVIGRWK
jgi:hypothetical protein